jgi:hypothetical protein
MWDGSLVFYFLKLPVEDGPARTAAVVAAVHRQGEFIASMCTSWGLEALLPAKPLFSAALDAAVPRGFWPGPDAMTLAQVGIRLSEGRSRIEPGQLRSHVPLSR